MAPVLRISGRGSLTVTLEGLTAGQIEALRRLIQTTTVGTGSEPVPAFFSPDPSSVAVLTGTARQLVHFTGRMASGGEIPAPLSRKLHSLLDNFARSDYKMDCGGKQIDLGSRTHIMGILNVTPDSFSDGGLFADAKTALGHAREMAAAGADIIDIGGESTRPGSEPLSEEEELRRVIPVIERLTDELDVPVSIDTYKSRVAEKALAAGASIVNDISGLRFSPEMAKVVADAGAAVVIMHIKGTPRNMQQNPVYGDVVGEIRDYLEEGIEIAGRAGVDREKTMIDPGIGFGKTLEHNLVILNRLDEFRSLGRPVVLGTSRKKFIGTILDIPVPAERIDGTAATVALGIERGAHIVRVHDVARMADVARMTDAILKSVQSS